MGNTREEIVSIARDYLGTRYEHQGRDPANGLDCVGLLIVVSKRLGLNVKDIPDYSPEGDPRKLLYSLNKYLTRVDASSVKPGNVITLRIRQDEPTHVGIVGQLFQSNQWYPTIIHTHTNVGKVVEHAIGSWMDRITHVYDFPGVVESVNTVSSPENTGGGGGNLANVSSMDLPSLSGGED